MPAGHAERGVDPANGPVQLAADRGGQRGQVAVVIGGGAGPLQPVQLGVGHQRVPLGLRGDRLVSMAPVKGLPGDSGKLGQWPLRRVSVRRMRSQALARNAEYVRASADCEQLDSAGMYTLVEGQGGALLCGKFERLAGPAVVM